MIGCCYVPATIISIRNKERVQQLQESNTKYEEIIKTLKELIKTKGDEVAILEKQWDAIISEVTKLEQGVKQREDDIQKMQHKIDIKKEETEKQTHQLLTEMKELLDKRFVFYTHIHTHILDMRR